MKTSRYPNDRSDPVFSIGLMRGIQISRAAVNSIEMSDEKMVPGVYG